MGNWKKMSESHTGQLSDAYRQQSNTDYSDLLKSLVPNLAQAKDRSDIAYGQASQRFNDPNRGMSINPNAQGWFNLPGGGTSALGGGGSQYRSSARGGYEDFAKTGGINRGDWEEAQGLYRRAASGEVPNADAIRYRATAMVPAFYDQYKNELARRSNVQGGYSPGFNAQMAEIGREKGREGYNASRMAEADIADRAIGQMQFGTRGLGDLASTIAGMEQGGRLSGLGGLAGIDRDEASFGEAAAGRNLQASKWDQDAQLGLQKMWQEGGQFNAKGLMDLYTSSPGEFNDYLNTYLEALRGRSASDIGYMGLRDRGQTGWDQVSQILGLYGGALGGMYTGGRRT